MDYPVKDFSYLLGLRGFSGDLLKNHFKLYEGYVKHTNKLIKVLKTANPDTQAYDEMKRRFAWEFNGMKLHEAYFGNLSKTPSKIGPKTPLAQQMIHDFGSLKAWEADFRAVSSMRGIGWAHLVWDPEGNRLFNVWINEHATGHLFHSVGLLVNDVFEHAFITDYGLDRKGYIEAFLKAVDWPVVSERFETGCLI
jgi:superoxide dismutase, Fe-Mn family